MPKKEPEKTSKSTKKTTKEKNPNRQNTPHHLAMKESCKKLKEENLKKDERAKRALGRPTLYKPELADYIIDRVASSPLGLKTLCETDPIFPDRDTVNLWRWKHPEFSARYLAAKQMQAHLLAEECEEEAKEKYFYVDATGEKRVDGGFIASQRLVVDTRKWYVGKMCASFYGDKKMVEEIKDQNDGLKAEIMALREELARKSEKDY